MKKIMTIQKARKWFAQWALANLILS